MKRQNIRLLLVVLALSCTSLFATAQPGGPDDPGDPGTDPDPGTTQIPFDGGLSLIIASGVAYAAKKGIDRRKKQQGQTPQNNI